MLDPNSRYYQIATAAVNVTDGTGRTAQVLYKRRRLLPPLRGQSTLLEYTVREQDRLDNIAAQYLGDGQQSYRLGDANPVLHPDELLVSGRRIRISIPGF